MTQFITSFGDQPNELAVQSGKYRLIRGAFCPFAHRAVITWSLLGLDEHISLGTVDDVNTPEGLTFTNSPNGKDPVLKVSHMRDLYLQTDSDYDGSYSVPVLVDIESGKIIRKESAEILRDFSTKFKPLHRAGAPDLYPIHQQEEIDQWNKKIGTTINSGIYRIGFAKSQEKYEVASANFFEALDEIEEVLAEKRYLVGDQITESDLFLYVTLVRFDIAYYSMFKANRNKLQDFPNLWAYSRDLYQKVGFKDTTDPKSIKRGFNLGTMGDQLKSNGIIPVGPDMTLWEKPHNRGK